jgi:hypothetical protein
MKKILLALLIAGPAVSHAQSKFYMTLGAAYNLPAAQLQMPYMGLEYNGRVASYERSLVSYSLQKGILGSLTFGRRIGNFAALELGLRYMPGASSKAVFKTLIANDEQYEYRVKASGISVAPAIRLSAPLSDNTLFYVRAGIVIPAFTKVKSGFDGRLFNEDKVLEQYSIETVVRHKIAIGYTASLGFSWKLSSSVRLNTDVNVQMLNAWARKSEVTKFTINNQPQRLKYSDQHTEYVKSINNTHNYNGGMYDRPGTDFTYQLPFSSVGLQAGLQFDL